MKKTKRKWDLLSEKERKKVISELIDFYKTERDEDIGIIAADEILDVLLRSSAINIYNKGIQDTSDFVKEKFEEIGVDIEINLKK